MRATTEHPVRPLRRGTPRRAAVRHDEFLATEYELYIPAGIWTHTAVREFLDQPLRAEGGATISKGATGVWRGGEEETHVIRIVVHRSPDGRDRFFDVLQRRVGRLMARLAEWPEARQQEVMFTSKEVRVGVSRLAVVAAPRKRRRRAAG
ncbi:MAG TPA: hypothetical protein VFD92_25160 [Candidatus Binatia bacterium]|nr:hypothetical protein [Candidatus Binatia bacterium]